MVSETLDYMAQMALVGIIEAAGPVCKDIYVGNLAGAETCGSAVRKLETQGRLA